MARRLLSADDLGAAVDALMAHRLRATLSAIGIVTGVGTVVAALAIAAGARRQAIDEIGGLGVNNVIVRATSDSSGRRTADWLAEDDARSAAARLPGTTVAVLKTVQSTARASDRTVDVTVAGVSPSWRDVAGLSVDEGRWFDAADRRARTAVIGRRLARQLFDERSPIGRLVEAAGEWRRVVGVLADGSDGARTSTSAATAVQSLDSSLTVFVPLESLDLALWKNDPGDAISQFVVHVRSGSDVTRQADAVRTLLAERHDRETPVFEVVVPRELLQARLRTQRRFNMLLFSMGALALIVSGVGIMNIMVASVTERAAEIGVRRAFGARRSAILVQFGAEAALLSVVSGLAGIPAGIAGAAVAAWLAGWPIAVTAPSVLVALALALVVGLSAAIYPAHLAASMSPTDALRSGV